VGDCTGGEVRNKDGNGVKYDSDGFVGLGEDDFFKPLLSIPWTALAFAMAAFRDALKSYRFAKTLPVGRF
jgi:hypothetical protein